MRQLVYTSLLLPITLHLTCSEGKFAQLSRSVKIIWTWFSVQTFSLIWQFWIFVPKFWSKKESNVNHHQIIHIRISVGSKFLNFIRLQDLFKMFSRRLQDGFKTSCQHIFKMSSRCLQDVLQNVFKTSSRLVQDVLKTSLRLVQDVLKTSSRCLEDVLQRSLQDVFKTYHQAKLFLLTRFQNDFETSSKRF